VDSGNSSGGDNGGNGDGGGGGSSGGSGGCAMSQEGSQSNFGVLGVMLGLAALMGARRSRRG
jgi:MYXO-CTERM domain-containing protein